MEMRHAYLLIAEPCACKPVRPCPGLNASQQTDILINGFGHALFTGQHRFIAKAVAQHPTVFRVDLVARRMQGQLKRWNI